MPCESKGELTDRLRREGRFEPFKRRREELRAKGVPAKEAWFEAAVEFGPMTPENEPAKPAIDLLPLKGKPAIPIDKVAAWVFEYLDADWITPADAPSLGAWSMLTWARNNALTRSDFYRLFAAKLVPTSQERARQIGDDRKHQDSAFYETPAQFLARCQMENQQRLEASLNRQ